ncbi:nucleoside triphosphate pyrophosphohydrolase [Calderihabitans maritimus]|uniref:Nucleotide pyrophosphohydrolase n=1 Tax=Calderihabitans maritimus TaxID=1246530 RepID=A0A1Z5HQM2_9FIRM|nr:nucleoside triphosphate pyrophosphohydrolase [Calderihabitans maritimus]GAW91667.1 nucleotide pyrophosphohydrolase [Calderihabitans maritimus]
MKKVIQVVGLGPGAPEQLPLGVLKILRSGAEVFLRTEKHPTVNFLRQEGIPFSTFDYLYETKKTFEEIYSSIVSLLLERVLVVSAGEIVYAVPGNPLVAEKSVELLMQEARRKKIEVFVTPAMGFVEAVCSALKIDPIGGIKVLDGLALKPQDLDPTSGLLIAQVYSRHVASEVKLTLMEVFSDECRIKVVKAAGIPGDEKIEEIPLYELDRLPWIDYLTTVYVPPAREKIKPRTVYPLDSLVEVMARLRSEDGCPWDRAQTHESLKRYLIEETYEVIEAIEEENMHKLCEELGDLLLQIVFHTQLATERDFFDINDVIRGIVAKMIRRHPHVFGDVKADTPDEVRRNWENIKQEERGPEKNNFILNVPRGLPALIRAEKVQNKAAKVGFDWPDVEGVWKKIEEEIEEFKEAINSGDRKKIYHELGDLLFAVVNAARFLAVDPEEALHSTTKRFIQRFSYMEEQARRRGKRLENMTLEEMDALWEEAKRNQGFSTKNSHKILV